MAGPTDFRSIQQDEHDITGKARRSLLVDANGAVISASNKLPVDATLVVGDIEIGAVELKNGSDDTRAIVTAANALKVDGSAVTQPVSGTFWQATQPVSGTFYQTTQPVSGTFWQATQPVSGTVNVGTVTTLPAVTATVSGTVGTKYVDTDGTAHGYKDAAGSPQICSQPYLQAIAEGDITSPTVHTPWSKIGYNGGIVASTEADVWSGTGTINYPPGNVAIAVVSSVATTDTGTSIFSGTSSGGTTMSLIDATKNFNGGTAVETGDIIVLDKSGTTPEWGYVTAVTSNTELAVAGGFSSGGTGYGTAGRAYTVIDKNTALQTGAKAVKIEYLTPAYAQKSEIVLLNGSAEVNTVNTDMFRINSFRVIATGSGNKPAGNLSLKAQTPTATVYSYISASYTRARNISYTVPAGKTLYVTSGTFAYAYSHNSTHYARLYTRANIEPSTGLNTGSEFFAFTEVVCSNSTVVREFECPTKIPAKTDIKISIIADYAGIATVSLRGWLE